jgi:hypothetical protein
MADTARKRSRRSGQASLFGIVLQVPPGAYIAVTGEVPLWARVWTGLWLSVWLAVTIIVANNTGETP